MNNTIIIAEAGVNHNGDMAVAKSLIDAAADAGADFVKFQTFNAADLATRQAEQADYQQKSSDSACSQYEMLERLALSPDQHFELQEHCTKSGIQFLSTAFDSESLRFLVEDIQLPVLKISSGELNNAPLLVEFAQTGKPLILSTGMASLSEVEQALSVLAWALASEPHNRPTRYQFAMAWADPGQRAKVQGRVTLLHCTSQYPAPVDQVNLKVMDTMAQCFGVPTGYSDHTEGIHIAIAAAARGAKVVEKHFTLNRNMPGPDHMTSVEPEELYTMVRAIREVERALGNHVKTISQCEVNTAEVSRKSIVARRAIKVGEVFTEDNLCIKRPGTGRDPMAYWSLLGQMADRDYKADDFIA